MTGMFRYIRHHEVAARLDHGWRYAGTLGRTHGEWSVLMWWCCGDCMPGEAP
jgi:hypothetical protein